MLIAALSQMLKDREVPSSSHASGDGSVGRERAASGASPAEGAASGGEGEEGRAGPGVVLPEDRQRAIELLREGEASVLRCSLAWVEVGEDATRS